MGRIGIAEHRILTHQVDGLHWLQVWGLDDLGQGPAWRGAQLSPPGLLELLLHLGIGHGLIAWIDGGQGAHVAGALDVILAPEGVNPCGRLADIAGEHGQIGDGHDIIRAV